MAIKNGKSPRETFHLANKNHFAFFYFGSREFHFQTIFTGKIATFSLKKAFENSCFNIQFLFDFSF